MRFDPHSASSHIFFIQIKVAKQNSTKLSKMVNNEWHLKWMWKILALPPRKCKGEKLPIHMERNELQTQNGFVNQEGFSTNPSKLVTLAHKQRRLCGSFLPSVTITRRWLNVSQPNFGTRLETRQIWKGMSKIWSPYFLARKGGVHKMPMFFCDFMTQWLKCNCLWK